MLVLGLSLRERAQQCRLRFGGAIQGGQRLGLAFMGHEGETGVRRFARNLDGPAEESQRLILAVQLVQAVPNQLQIADVAAPVAPRDGREQRFANPTTLPSAR